VNYTLDLTQDLLVAFDVSPISATPGEGNVCFGGLPGAHAFSNLNPPGAPEARVQNRTTPYQNDAPDTLALVELIEVL
jgi:hypothetical protein